MFGAQPLFLCNCWEWVLGKNIPCPALCGNFAVTVYSDIEYRMRKKVLRILKGEMIIVI